MDLYRPRRLLGGLFGKRYSTSAATPQQPSCTTDSAEKVEKYCQPDDQLSTSVYSEDETSLLQIAEQRDIVVEELRITRENLAAEKKLTHDLNQRLIMKAISIDCQLSDTEEKFKKSQAKIDAANLKNNDLADKLIVVRMENQNLMKRTAALARRDQIQKATILTSNAEIIKLMSTIEAFQERFLSLADAVVINNENNMTESNENLSNDGASDIDESQHAIPLNISSEGSVTPFERDQMTPSEQKKKREKDEYKVKQIADYKARQEDFQAKTEEFQAKQEEFRAIQEKFHAIQEEHQARQEEWHAERNDLFGCISKLKSNNAEIRKKFVQTLKKHQWKWHKQKEKLMKKMGDLEVVLEEKDAELLLAKSAIADAVARGKYYPNKGDPQHPDTFATMTTQEESLSNCSSSSLTLTHSLTETSNNLSTRSKTVQKLDIVEPIDNRSYSFSLDPHSVESMDENRDDASMDDGSYSSSLESHNVAPLRGNGVSADKSVGLSS
jgi:hypothetical protein